MRKSLYVWNNLAFVNYISKSLILFVRENYHNLVRSLYFEGWNYFTTHGFFSNTLCSKFLDSVKKVIIRKVSKSGGHRWNWLELWEINHNKSIVFRTPFLTFFCMFILLSMLFSHLLLWGLGCRDTLPWMMVLWRGLPGYRKILPQLSLLWQRWYVRNGQATTHLVRFYIA